MKYSSRSACLGAIFLLSCCSVLFAYSGGNGTSADPYQISNVTDWNQLAGTSSDWDKCFVLVSDINFAGASLTPVATADLQFTGVFDGGGHKLSNATITDSTYYGYEGLFSCVGASGAISNLGVENVTVSNVAAGQNKYIHRIGGLCGLNNGAIRSCYTTGDVVCPPYVHGLCRDVGGLCGENRGSIVNCYATGKVSGSRSIGGLCGHNAGTIRYSHATGEVDGGGGGGGLCGENYGTISMCYATGGTRTEQYDVGGLCAANYGGTISNSYAWGYVYGGHSSWGPYGTNYYGPDEGGLCGYNAGTISECYSTGRVVNMVEGYAGCAGGLCGVRSSGARVINSFWNKETSGRSTSAGGSGRTTNQMQTETTFSKAGWDFVNVWRMPTSGHPVLATFAVTTTSLPSGYANTSYSGVLEAIGGTPPCTWSLDSGSLPAGLTLSTATGVISGTPVNTGSWSFAVAASHSGDSHTPPETRVQPLSMKVYPAIPPREVNWLAIDRLRLKLVPGAPGGASFVLTGSYNMWYDDTMPKSVTLSIGSWSVTIDKAWKQVGSSTKYTCKQSSGQSHLMFQGDVNGLMTYWVNGTTKCTFQFAASRQVLRPNLPDLANVPVRLQCGSAFDQTVSLALAGTESAAKLSSVKSLPAFWIGKLTMGRNLKQANRDSLSLTAKLLLAEEFDPSSDSIEMEIGPYLVSLPAGTLPAVKNDVIRYSTVTGDHGRLTVVVDAKKGTLSVTATKIDLSALTADTHVALAIGNHPGATWDYGICMSKNKTGTAYKY